MRHVATIALIALAGCRDGAAEPYVRLRDPAPAALALQEHEAQLVALWGSWCPPCREETKALQALAQRPPDGVQVVIVAVDEPDAAARGTFPAARVIADPQGELARTLRADELPAAFLVKGSRLVARFDGARAWDGARARSTLEKLVRESERTAVDGR